jgi:hypothetical protein
MSVKNNLWVVFGLVGLMLLTRTNHFGDRVYLPDATLAVMLLGGLLLVSFRWFWLAIAVAFGVDFYALGFQGVSEYCMSLGYWGLIPTYAVVWGAGQWLAKNTQQTTITRAVVALAAFSVAFVLSNAFWYAFSDKVATLSMLEFAGRVAHYYTPYVGYAMMYLGFAWVLAKVLSSFGLLKQASSV